MQIYKEEKKYCTNFKDKYDGFKKPETVYFSKIIFSQKIINLLLYMILPKLIPLSYIIQMCYFLSFLYT